jgi:hypothetical protein
MERIERIEKVPYSTITKHDIMTHFVYLQKKGPAYCDQINIERSQIRDLQLV